MRCWVWPRRKQDYDQTSRYERKQFLESGGHGKVFVEYDKQAHETVAVKYIPRNKVDRQVRREVLNFSRCQHPHIISFREVFLTPTDLAISMEYAHGGNLLQYINNRGFLAEAEARSFWQQIIAGVDHCHRQDIVLRDIKPENTLVLGSQPGRGRILKLCDFGTSFSDETGTITQTAAGTAYYSSPEQLLRSDRRDERKGDVWSAGVVLYCMVYGRHPFGTAAGENAPAQTNCYRNIAECRYSLPDTPKLSGPLKDLFRKIFVASPEQRISIAGIYRHPWFVVDLPLQYHQVEQIKKADLERIQKQQQKREKRLQAIIEKAMSRR